MAPTNETNTNFGAWKEGQMCEFDLKSSTHLLCWSFVPSHHELQGRQVWDEWEASVKSCGPRHPEWETSMGDKWETSGRQVGDKCKLMRAAAKGIQSGRQVWETSLNSCAPHPQWETSVGDKCKLMRPKAPRVRDKCGRQGGDKCKVMRSKTPRVQDKCGRQVCKTSVGDKCARQAGDKCKIMRQKAPKCEGQVGDKCKIMRPKAPRVGDKCGRVGDKWKTSVKLMRAKAPRVRDKCGRQVGDKCKLMRPKEPRVGASVGDKCARQVWETSVGDKCGRQV